MRRTVLTLVTISLVAMGAHLLIPLEPHFACAPLPGHEPKSFRHGQNHWSDAKLRVFSAMSSGVQVPNGWAPVGAEKIANDCALFPHNQAVVFIKPEFWRIDELKSKEVGITFRRLVLATTPETDVQKIDRMILDTHKRVSKLFPLGLLPNQKSQHDILVSIGIAGDPNREAGRVYAFPGANLSNIFYGLDNSRGMDLFIHSIAHIYNKKRGRPETAPQDDDLPMTEYREFVASWAELAFNHNHVHVRRRVNFLNKQHRKLFDADPATWPTYSSIKDIQSTKGPYGIPPYAPVDNVAAHKYAHYYLSPLILLGIDGLLAIDAPDLNVKMMLREIHAGKSPGLLSSLKKYMPMRYSLIQKWMHGEKQVSSKLIKRGLVRLHSGSNEDL